MKTKILFLSLMLLFFCSTQATTSISNLSFIGSVNSIVKPSDNTTCIDESRVIVSPPTANSQSFCIGEGMPAKTVLSLKATGTSLRWYMTATGGTTLDITTVLVSSTYYVSQTVNGEESARTSVAVTVTKIARPTGLACYQTATFNDKACKWDVAGTQPIAPSGLRCYETAIFNPATCYWDVIGTEPVLLELACYETATFNTTSCQWVISGTKPPEPVLGLCSYAIFEDGGSGSNVCDWVVKRDPAPAIPTGQALQTNFAATSTIANLVVSPSNVSWFSSLADAIAGKNKLLKTTVLTNGATYYAVNYRGSCPSTPFAVTVTVALGTTSFNASSVYFYPNPTKSILILQNKNSIPLDKIIVTDLTGKVILTQTNNTTQVNVEKLAFGVYVIEAVSGKEKFVSKFVKE